MIDFKHIYDKINYTWFVINGKKPWSRGYNAYKKRQICKVLSRGDFNPTNLPTGYGFRIDERIIEYPWFFSRLPSGRGRLLDAGSVLNFDFILHQNVLKSKKIYITTLAPELNCFWRKGISYIYEDLRYTCFRDNYFDWIACLSTLEHIGMDNTLLYTSSRSKKENSPTAYLLAIKEFRRILKPGGVLYASVPFGRYKNHGWFQVFDGAGVDRLIETFSPVSFIESCYKYEPNGWRVSARDECKDAVSFDMQMHKKCGKDYAAASGATVCLEMIK